MSEHDNAEYIHARVLSAGTEFYRKTQDKSLSVSARLNAGMDMNACNAAASLIRELDTEVTRLRQAIGCFHYTGDPTSAALWRIAQTWNGENTMRPSIPKTIEDL